MTSRTQASQPTNQFDTTPRRTAKQEEEVRTEIAMWATAIILVLSLIIIGSYSAAWGLVFMIATLTGFAIFFALK